MKRGSRHARAWLLAVAVLASSAKAEDLDVLPETLEGGPAREMLSRHLLRLAGEAFQRRRSAFEALDSKGDVAARQDELRAAFVEHLGGFPERTPLAARTVGTLETDAYRVEKLIYESQPDHYVTATLFLPRGDPPHPAVLVPCGHSSDGKVSNQRVCIALALHGIAALCYDPIGQGERYQLLDADGEPRFKSTTEHTLVGASCILLGRSTATYRVWDGMRSIDYLTSRDDIDASRIGVTGCSGGGTLTSYLMALDDRVACAAPSCYLTSFARLLETIGPQDAEQNIHGQIAWGMDHADYVILRAPKPTLILASTRDFFDIRGTWDSFRDAKRVYTRLGHGERVSLVETDARHGYPRLQREAMVRWMRRWLMGVDDAVTEPSFETHPASALRCTPQGQVLLMEGSRSVVDLNVELDQKLQAGRRERWKAARRDETLADVRRIARIRDMEELPRASYASRGAVEREGYEIEKLVLRTGDGIALPALLFRPGEGSGERCLYVHGEGKRVDAGRGGAIEARVREGQLVLAVDLRGNGETGTTGGDLWGGDWDDIFLAYLLGRSLVGMRAEDVLTSARFLSELGVEGGREASPVRLVAVGAAGVPALHASALETELFRSVELRGTLESWSEAIRRPGDGGLLASAVHGALRVYDLPDLADSLRARGVDVASAAEPTSR